MKEIPSYFAYFAFLPRCGNLDFLADHNLMIRFEIFFSIGKFLKNMKTFSVHLGHSAIRSL